MTKEIVLDSEQVAELNKIVKQIELPKEEEQKDKIFFEIGKARKAKKWTRAELSEKSGVEENTIMQMETMIGKPQLIEVIKVCNALDLNVTVN